MYIQLHSTLSQRGNRYTEFHQLCTPIVTTHSFISLPKPSFLHHSHTSPIRLRNNRIHPFLIHHLSLLPFTSRTLESIQLSKMFNPPPQNPLHRLTRIPPPPNARHKHIPQFIQLRL